MHLALPTLGAMLLTVVVVFACAAVSDVLKLGQTAGQDTRTTNS